MHYPDNDVIGIFLLLAASQLTAVSAVFILVHFIMFPADRKTARTLCRRCLAQLGTAARRSMQHVL